MAARFRMKKRGVGALLKSPLMEAEMLRRAAFIADVAVALSPVGDAAWDPHPGHYKASWKAELTNKRIGRSRKRRATATVSNTSFYARWVEFGTERVPAHHVLLRAAKIGGK